MKTTPTCTRREALRLGGSGLLLAGTAGGLAGCATAPDLERYAGERPVFNLRRYFDGALTAQGLFSDRFGHVRRRFTVAMSCTWRGDEGVLDEAFTYNDGERERRVWRLRDLGQGRYSGGADDVVGTAQGGASGHAFRWRYVLRLPVDGRVWEVDMDDWMFQIDERHVLNRATMSKWGIRLGEVQLAFQRTGAA